MNMHSSFVLDTLSISQTNGETLIKSPKINTSVRQERRHNLKLIVSDHPTKDQPKAGNCS